VAQQPRTESNDNGNDGLESLLDQELARLPDKYRSAVVLCDLEGKTRQEVARELGCPEGTVASRLDRARSLLANRLTRRGLALPAGALAAMLSAQTASAAVTADLFAATLQASIAFATGNITASGATVLAEKVVTNMLWQKFKVFVVVMLGLCLLAAGGELARQTLAGPSQPLARLAEPGQKTTETAGLKTTAGLAARIQIRQPLLQGTVVRAELVLSNQTGKPMRLCTLVNGPRSGTADGSWFSATLRPDWWKSDSPTDEMSAKHIVTLAPGKSIQLPLGAGVTNSVSGSLKIEAGYAIGDEFAKRHNTWSGKVKAEPITVKVRRVEWLDKEKDLQPSGLAVEPITGTQVLRTDDGLELPLAIKNNSQKPITVRLAHEWHGGELPPTALYAAVTPVGTTQEPVFRPVYLAGKLPKKSVWAPTIPLGITQRSGNLRMDFPGTGSVQLNPLLEAAKPGVFRVQLLMVFEADGVRQYVLSPTRNVTVPRNLPKRGERPPLPVEKNK
jgi:hypothetical protein